MGDRKARSGGPLRWRYGTAKRVSLLLALLSLAGRVGAAGSAEPGQDELPESIEPGQSFSPVEGEILEMPCVKETQRRAGGALWRRVRGRGLALALAVDLEGEVLTAGGSMISQDRRLRLLENNTLQISAVNPKDAGKYRCEDSERQVVHSVTVMVPPSLVPRPSLGALQARKGQSASLQCDATGSPEPTVTWTRINDSARMGEGPILVLEKVDRGAAGRYRCTVDNGVGAPQHRDFELQVLHPPELEVSVTWLRAASSFHVELLCAVLADPPAEVSWSSEVGPVISSQRLVVSSRGQKHSLLITDVQPEDFGNYSCRAENSEGSSSQQAEVTGRAGPARFSSAPLSTESHSYTLAFQLDSYPPLRRLRLLYRQVEMKAGHLQGGPWREVEPPLADVPDGGSAPVHRITHTLRQLCPASQYEVVVQAGNQYGWDKVSDVFQFSTPREDGGGAGVAEEGGQGPARSGGAEARTLRLTAILSILFVFRSASSHRI